MAPRVEQEHHTTNFYIKKNLISLLRTLLQKLEFLGLIRLWIDSSCYPRRKEEENLLNLSHFGRDCSSSEKFEFPAVPFATASCFTYTGLSELSNPLPVDAMALGSARTTNYQCLQKLRRSRFHVSVDVSLIKLDFGPTENR